MYITQDSRNIAFLVHTPPSTDIDRRLPSFLAMYKLWFLSLLPPLHHRLNWGKNLYTTYPFHLHNADSRTDPGYYIRSIGHDSTDAVIVSKNCRQYAADGGACKPCATLAACVDVVKHRASARDSYSGLVEELNAAKAQINNLKLEKLNYKRSFDAAHSKIFEYEYLVEVIAGHEIPGLQRLFRTSYGHRDGIGGLLKRVELAAAGKYRPRDYTDTDRDLAMAFYELGGAPDVQVSDGVANIQTLFRPLENITPTKCGHSLALDEVASNGTLVYLPETDEMAGLCREHVGDLPGGVTMGSDLTNVMAAAQAVKGQKVHIGKEITCAAICSHSETGYGAKPIVISSTCKHGTVYNSVRLIMTCLRAWKDAAFGASTWGPIWAIASDGDATRRASMYAICMRRKLSPSSSLYRRLRGCIGLNLWVGEDDITMDFDYKHIFKRLCTLFCSKEGLMVNGISINKLLLSQWLEKLTAFDWSDTSIHALLNPKDPQDVPRAIQLLLHVSSLRDLDTSDFSPADQAIHKSLSLLGEAIHGLIQPFIDPSMSLSDQITSLITAAYIICALYRVHVTSFISNQLYGDLQCMIKNALFHVAKTQDLDPNLKVFLCLLGDDVLETLFGRVRMIGGHSPNVDIAEFANRCRSALNLDDIFSRHPLWERKPERLK
ncbi:hypothetical protein BDZ89DRAFT_1131159 [Hymenopellis radicata]|nr:hypothetical protein BDZ89DRAFT_1131159 [Hymenopellis radicata]